MNFVLKNGALVTEDQACISMMHPLVQFGEGVFTTARVYKKKIEFLDSHLQRLFVQAQELKIKPVTITEADLRKLIIHACEDDGVYKLKIIVFQEELESSYVAFIEPHRVQLSDTFSLMSMHGHMPMSAKIKTVCCLDKRMCKAVAQTQGFDDMLLLDANNLVLETACANIFWKLDHVVYTPKRELPLLWGVSIRAVEQWAHHFHYEFQEVEVSLDALPVHANYYISNVMIWFKPVIVIDEKRYERDLLFEKQLKNWYDSRT